VPASATLDIPDAAEYGDTQLDPDSTAAQPPEDDPNPGAALPVGPDASSWDAPDVFLQAPLRSAVAAEDTTIDRSAIVDYAVDHVGVVNTDLHGGANPWNPDYVSFGNDCQNFVSQALYAGGWPTIGDQFTYSPTYASAWWYVHNSGFLSAESRASRAARGDGRVRRLRFPDTVDPMP